MNCMKCGRDLEEGQVFCDSCLEIMKKYPVKPGTVIQLPQKKDLPVQKKAQSKRRQAPNPEEQIQKLRTRLRRTMILWFITALLLASTIYPTWEYIRSQFLPQPGQNYTTITGTNPTDS